ncbi:MAG: hypothetical protein QJR07_20820 [Acetobacteraceae bacterium]|nr:hypothetical protein [Acetobacteraceae bacterium]
MNRNGAGAQVSSIARGEPRLPFERRDISDGYAAPGPVITRRLTPEELERYLAMRDGRDGLRRHIVDPLVGDRRVMLAAMEAVRAAGIELHAWPPSEDELRAVAAIGFSAAMIARLYRINVAQAKGQLDRLGIELRGDWRPSRAERPEPPQEEPAQAADAPREEVEETVPLTWPASRAELEELVGRGLSNAEIGRRYGVSAGAVAFRLHKFGIRRTPQRLYEIAGQRPGRQRQQPQPEPQAAQPQAAGEAPGTDIDAAAHDVALATSAPESVELASGPEPAGALRSGQGAAPAAALEGTLLELGGAQGGPVVLLDGHRAIRAEDAIRAVLIDAGDWRGRRIRIEVA